MNKNYRNILTTTVTVAAFEAVLFALGHAGYLPQYQLTQWAEVLGLTAVLSIGCWFAASLGMDTGKRVGRIPSDTPFHRVLRSYLPYTLIACAFFAIIMILAMAESVLFAFGLILPYTYFMGIACQRDPGF